MLPILARQAALLGIPESAINDSSFEGSNVFINHILLIFTSYRFKSREIKFINLDNLIVEIRKVKLIGFTKK